MADSTSPEAPAAASAATAATAAGSTRTDADSGASGASGTGSAGELKSKTPCVLCIGMAGSGKTSFMQRLNAHLHTKGRPCYVVNLDPAVHNTPFDANIDVRDTVNYKEVMKQYDLGPNGGIVTSLNLFATRFDQVLGLLEKRASEHSYMLFDTPGQIEVFTWSASGAIITESLAASFPTVVVYVLDTPRCVSPVTFMSNMLYACSILYKTRLPFVLAFNKVDVVSHDFAVSWMQDYEVFQEAVAQETSYIGSLARSMAVVLEEFYQNLRAVGVSALTGQGMDEFFEAVDSAVQEYMTEYRPIIDQLRKEKADKELAEQRKSIEKLSKDLQTAGHVVLDATAPLRRATGDEEIDSDDERDLEDRGRAQKQQGAMHAAFVGKNQADQQTSKKK